MDEAARRSLWSSSALGAIAIAVAGSVVAPASFAAPAGATKQTTVTITVTPQGCATKPASVPTGQIQFDVKNQNAKVVSETELRSRDLSRILGEQANLTPGLSGGFALVVQPGRYFVVCPSASTPKSSFTVTGTSKAADWKANSALVTAVRGYETYVHAQTANLVASTQTMCTAVDAGNQAQAEQLYPQARIYYERIEPVAEVWGTLDTQIDGRWENPVTVESQFMGFHRIEQLLWSDDTLDGVSAYCGQLVQHEQQLQQLAATASYDPVTMAVGATDLINEAATSKITGEEERYSNVDLIDFQANVNGAMEVFDLLKPALVTSGPSSVSEIQRRFNAVEHDIAAYKTAPGYDDTGYVDYATVSDAERRQLSDSVQAFAESLSKMSGHVQ